jgi:hypothetical protein
LAVRTGVAFDVLDVDSDEALGRLRELAGYRPLVWGPIARTPRGWHFYFAARGRNRVAVLPGIDVRGDGGYCVCPPSSLGDGRDYRWIAPPSTPVTDPAGWLAELLDPTEPKSISRTEPWSPPVASWKARRYARAALEGEAAAVASAPEGQRNDRLNRSAFRIGQLVAAGQIDPADAIDVLEEAARFAGLGEREAERTVRSGLEAGREKPR